MKLFIHEADLTNETYQDAVINLLDHYTKDLSGYTKKP